MPETKKGLFKPDADGPVSQSFALLASIVISNDTVMKTIKDSFDLD